MGKGDANMNKKNTAPAQGGIQGFQQKQSAKSSTVSTGDLRREALGRWGQIHAVSGIPERFLRLKKCQPCPMCGGRDRYHYSDRKGRGTYLCRKCGGGDGFDLLMRYHDWDFNRAADEVRQVLGLKAWKPQPVETISLYSEVEAAAFVRAHEGMLRRGISTSATHQQLYRQFQRVLCAPFTPGEVVDAHFFCLAYSGAVQRGEHPSDEDAEIFLLCAKVRDAVKRYVPYVD